MLKYKISLKNEFDRIAKLTFKKLSYGQSKILGEEDSKTFLKEIYVTLGITE